MSRTVVTCSMSDCPKPAQYKLGAPWSNGRVSELKNYGLACEDHLGPLFRSAEDRRAQYKAAPGESIDQIHIYRYETGQLDKQHPRLIECEEKCRSWGAGQEGV